MRQRCTEVSILQTNLTISFSIIVQKYARPHHIRLPVIFMIFVTKTSHNCARMSNRAFSYLFWLWLDFCVNKSAETAHFSGLIFSFEISAFEEIASDISYLIKPSFGKKFVNCSRARAPLFNIVFDKIMLRKRHKSVLRCSQNFKCPSGVLSNMDKICAFLLSPLARALSEPLNYSARVCMDG